MPDQLSAFTYELTRRATTEDLKKSRQEITKLEAFSRSAYKEESEARERVDVAENALNSDNRNEQLRGFYERRKERLTAATNQLAAITEQLHKKRQTLLEQEAYFCQSQLLDFIGSSRYSFSPLSFAKAMAGLPMITWRQSADRCRRFQIQDPYGFEYANFRLLAKALNNPPGSISTAVHRVKSFLMSLRGKDGTAGTLKKEWYYLRKAMETTYANDVRKGAVPFRVYAEYQRCTQSRSSIDLLMQEDEELQ